MAFTVSYTRTAADEFNGLPRRVKREVRAAVAPLGQDPRGTADAEWLKDEWEGYWRLRIGEHRAIYRIDDRVALVVIVRVGHRSQVYEGGPASLSEP